MKKLVLFSLLLSGVINGANIYQRLKDGYSLRSDFSSVENLINQKNAFYSGDRFGYLQQAYGFYKYGLPVYELEGKFYEFCPRSYLSSLIFLPFIFISKNYFELIFVVINFLAFAILLSILLHKINPKFYLINYFLVFLAIIYESSSSTRILLETVISNLYLLTFIFLLKFVETKKQSFLYFSLFFIFFSAGIRNENFILGIIIVLFTIRKLKDALVSFLIALPFLTLVLIKTFRCGDTSNFWGANFAGVKKYYLKLTNQDVNVDIWAEVIEDVNKKVTPPFGGEKALIMLDLKPYYTHMRDYERKRIIEMISERKEIILIGLFKFFFYNIGAILFTQPYEIEEIFNNLRFYNKDIIFFAIFIYNFLILISIFIVLHNFSKIETFYKIAFIVYLTLLIIYSFFTMFGEHDWTRYRNVFIPIELIVLLGALKFSKHD
jgi:hypothetical protein